MIAYAAALGLICAAVLTWVQRSTLERRRANRRAWQARNILDVLDVPYDRGAPPATLLAMLDSNVAEQEDESTGLTFYVYDHPAEGRLRAVEFGGPGLWGPIRGLLCLKRGDRVIQAVSFYQQEETPGLGGRIVEAGWRDGFRDKRITASGIRIVRRAERPDEVDAISGATMTCGRVESMLNRTIRRIAAEGGRDGE
jgi:Na+-transporting NADH:ubiquinone oxidoreductase subunit C